MNQEIEIVIGPDGKVKMEALGFKDGECALKTKPLIDALTGKVKTKKKPEYDIAIKKVSTNKSKL